MEVIVILLLHMVNWTFHGSLNTSTILAAELAECLRWALHLHAAIITGVIREALRGRHAVAAESRTTTDAVRLRSHSSPVGNLATMVTALPTSVHGVVLILSILLLLETSLFILLLFLDFVFEL